MTTHIFMGSYCTAATYAKWKAIVAKGRCPFCNRPTDKRYQNDKRHMVACPKNPKSPAVQ